MNFSEKTLNTKKIYDGRVINLRVDDVLLPNGTKGRREIVEHNGGVAIVAIKDAQILMVTQFRKPLEKTIIEIPAGKLEINEEPYDCAIRELEEETGFIPEKLVLMNTIYTSPGFSNERIYVYIADKIRLGKINRDADEFMDVGFFEVDKLIEMIKDGTIKDAKTICGILMYLYRRLD